MNTPQAPDPYATAAAQTASNKETAGYQQSLNMTNQVTPYGSVNYNQTGTAANGAPQYTAKTALSPEMQGLVGKGINNAQGNANLEGTLLGNSQAALSHPLDLSYGATEQHLNDMNRQTLDPQWAQLGEQNEQKLYDRGLTPGSAGYDASMRDFSNQRQNAYNSMYLQGHQTAVNDLTQQYNSPLNALSALRSNSQVQQPGVGQTPTPPQTGVAGTNVSGLVEQNYQNQLQSSSSTMGGLFGLGGSVLGGLAGGPFGAALGGSMFGSPLQQFYSDRRLKKNITYLGKAKNLLPLYSFEYVWGGGEKTGHMADEVEILYPHAVFNAGEFKAVNYGALQWAS